MLSCSVCMKKAGRCPPACTGAGETTSKEVGSSSPGLARLLQSLVRDKGGIHRASQKQIWQCHSLRGEGNVTPACCRWLRGGDIKTTASLNFPLPLMLPLGSMSPVMGPWGGGLLWGEGCNEGLYKERGHSKWNCNVTVLQLPMGSTWSSSALFRLSFGVAWETSPACSVPRSPFSDEGG